MYKKYLSLFFLFFYSLLAYSQDTKLQTVYDLSNQALIQIQLLNNSLVLRATLLNEKEASLLQTELRLKEEREASEIEKQNLQQREIDLKLNEDSYKQMETLYKASQISLNKSEKSLNQSKLVTKITIIVAVVGCLSTFFYGTTF